VIVGRDALRRVAEALRNLGTPVVFVGGAVPDLVVPEKVGPPPRPTRDIDVVVDVSTTLAYHR
jgi:tRNA nucleotidyltransferase/poly(A) polymerase